MDAARALLTEMFEAAIAAADPMRMLAAHLPEKPRGRVLVLGAGKASATMARAVEAAWPDVDLGGLVVVPYGHADKTSRIEIVEARHPVPDEAGLAATGRLAALADAAGKDDLVLCLISGGGSSLTPLPPPGMTLADEQALSAALLHSGADISEMNAVRKHLSRFKGGRLAALAAPSRLVTLTISDVPGDDPATIASGPTVPDPTTRDEARAVLARYGIDLPEPARAWLDDPVSETPKPGDAVFARAEHRMIAAPYRSLQAAASIAEGAGYEVHILGDAIEGEAREVARVHAGLVQSVRRHGSPFAAPCVLLSGGETTVTVRGDGRGGRNVEFLLALALALNGMDGVSALAGDTDGIDGAEPVAGALIDPTTLARARAAGIDPRHGLDRNDGHGVFAAIGDQVVTGPTLTNVNDFRAIVID